MARTRSFATVAAHFALMALLALSLVALGCSSPSSDDGDDTGTGTTDVGEPDVGEDTGGSGPDVIDVVEPDIPATECTVAGCEEELADQMGPCDEAICNDDGQCELQTTAAPECCETAEECATAMADDLGVCDVAVCNDSNVCETQTTAAPECCESAEDCATAMADDLGPCDEAVCNDSNVCETSRTTEAPDCCVDNDECVTAMADDIGDCETAVCNDSNACEVLRPGDVTTHPDFWPDACCLNDAECDDDDNMTLDSCPVVGGICHHDPQPCGSDSWCATNWEGTTPQLCQEVRCCLALECEDATGATIDNGACYIGESSECCISDADCDDGNPCTDCSCEPSAGGTCFCEPNDLCACEEADTFVASFDDPDVEHGGFTIFDYNTDDNVTWHSVREGLYSGRGIYLGDPECFTYFNGEHDENCEYDYPVELDPDHGTWIRVELVTPDINLPDSSAGGGLYMAEFFIMGEGEMPVFVGQNPDALTVRVEVVGDNAAYQNCLDPGHADFNSCLLFTTADYDNTIPMGMFVAAELSEYAGESIKLHFDFDTFDSSYNRYEGWYLDALRVRGYCANRRCDGGTTCNVLNACMDDSCTEFSNLPGAGICAETIEPPGCQPCQDETDCEDMDDCTDESCVDNVCVWTPDTSPACCSSIELLAADFESGEMPVDWSVDADGTDVEWQVLTDDDGSYLYFGDDETMTYANGGRAQGTVSTETFDLPDPASVQVVNLIAYWKVNLSTEFDVNQWAPDVAVDRLTLFINYLDEGGELQSVDIWNSAAIEGSTQGEWLLQGADLIDYAGKTVWFTWSFDSDDEYDNLYGGAMIDDFNIKTACGVVCFNDGMCEDEVEGNCYTSVCEDAVCSTPVLLYEGCCDAVEDCLLDGFDYSCTTVTCVANTCSYQDDGDAGTCCEGTSFLTAFDYAELPDSYQVTQVDNGDPLNAVTWQISERCGHDGGSGLYFGDEAFGDYFTNQATGVAGSVLTPEISIPSSGTGAATWLQFDLYLDTEWNDVPREGWTPPTGLERDKLTLSMVQGTTTTELWDSYGVSYRGSTCHDALCQWQTVQIDLSNFHGYSLQFLFEFDSLDDIDNEHLGACIDNLSIVTGCSGEDYECFESEDCPVGGLPDDCYWYYCVNNQCDADYIGGLNCCDVANVQESSWEAGDEGWSYFPADGDVRWQVASFADAYDGDAYLYFGNATAMDYDGAGSEVGGEANSPNIVLPTIDPDTDSITLRFAYYLDVEPYNVEDRDDFTVSIINVQSGAEEVLLQKSNIPESHIGSDPMAWHTWESDLSAHSGETVLIQFVFDSGDGTDNDGMGVLIDGFEIETEICD